MVALCNTVAFQGVDVVDVETQVQIASGLSAFTVVGLPDKAVAESRERVRAALGAMGLALPPKRITVNLALGRGESVHQKGVGFESLGGWFFRF